MDLHDLIHSGTLEELRAAIAQGANVNLEGHCGQTPLMAAVVVSDIAKVKLLVEYGADPEITDDFNSTPLRQAVECDFGEGVRYLLGLGVDRGHNPKYPLKKIKYPTEVYDSPLPESLEGILSEEEWAESIAVNKENFIASGQNPSVAPVIADVQSVQVLKLLLDAGEDLDLAPTDVKRAYAGLPDDATFECALEDYRKHRTPRFGAINPQSMDNPFWRDMVRVGRSAYSARSQFNDEHSFDSPVWSYDRFGSSLTSLSDGRFVQIAGEHEDYYDPDFCIYNDVVVHDGHGGFEIYGYPRDVFPPTDFHSATLVGDAIYIVGCLGYPDQRHRDFTPIYRLEVGSWKIEPVVTHGEMPSWLHCHRAGYEATQHRLIFTGGNLLAGKDLKIEPSQCRYVFDIDSLSWERG